MFLYESLINEITDLIEKDTFRAGDRLPSVRKLREQKQLSPATILQAYRILEDRGLVEARPQSGYYVKHRFRLCPPEPKQSAPPEQPTEVVIGDLLLDFFNAATDPKVVPLGAAIPNPGLLPTKKLNRLLANVARETSDRTEATPQGVRRLRTEIARHAFERGCHLGADEVIVTCGGTEALSLSLRAVAQAGDIIAVESPTYFGTLQIIDNLGMRAVEIPTHPRTGMDLDALERCMGSCPIKACVVVPTLQNPLGSIMPAEHKQRMVALLGGRGIAVIEDDINGDFAPGNPTPKALKAYDRGGSVLYCGSFSKTLAPDYRIGWVAAGKYHREALYQKMSQTFATPVALQETIAEYLKHGGYHHHLRQIKRTFCATLNRVTQAVARYFPKGTKATRPVGGFLLWVELPAGINAMDLYRRALRHNISIAPGPLFSAAGSFTNFLRLNCGYIWSERIQAALETLGRLAHELQDHRRLSAV